MHDASQHFANARLKAQVLRVAEVVKTGVDEVTELVCLWLDSQSETTKTFSNGNNEKFCIEELLTPSQLAKILQVSESSIRAKTERGEIQGYEVGKKDSQSKDYRYKLDEVLRSLATNPLQITVAVQQQTNIRSKR